MLKTITETGLLLCLIVSLGCGRGEAPQSPAARESDSHDRPERLVGEWRWTWSDGQRVILHEDGRATRVEGRGDHLHRKGTWHLRDDGVLEVTSKIEFRVDDDPESIERYSGISIMDIETIPTDHDFPWFKSADDKAREEKQVSARGDR